MINNYYRCELYIDGEIMEFGNNDIDIKLSDTLLQPTKLTASTVTYSYSFNIPSTPHNNRVLGNINVPEMRGKFNRRYKAQLYADNILIFDGSAKISSYSDGKYKCNLYINKANTVDSIFGDATLKYIDWKVPFKGNATINEINRDETSKYFFPYVAYGLPLKKPYNTTGSGVEYFTDKKTIDKYTRFYYDSFVPSMNMVELMKKCFEYKGLTLQGDILTDDVLNAIYLSNYIKDDQDPAYNLGENDIGDIKVAISWSNNYKSGNTFEITYDNAIQWNLDEDYLPKNARNISGSWYGGLENFTGNWDTFFAYNLLDKASIESLSGKTFMLGSKEIQTGSLDVDLQNNGAKQNIGDGFIKIPQDGWYEITIDGLTGIDDRDGNIGGTGLIRNSWEDVIHQDDNGNIDRKARTYKVNQWTQEFQLLRYRPDADNDENEINHNPLWGGEYPNEEGGWPYFYMNGKYQKVREDNKTTAMCDPYNNPNYICGWMYSKEGAQLGYIKNGKSWQPETYDKNECLYNCEGYYKFDASNLSGYTGSIDYVGDYPKTDFDENTLNGYSNFNEISVNGREVNGKLRCIVKLSKNDLLIPYVNCHGLIDGATYQQANERYVTYRSYAKINMHIRPLADSKTSSKDLSYGMTTKWDTQLNLANFLNSEQKISEFITNIQKSFNLSFERNGNDCIMNINKNHYDITTPVDIDSRYNIRNAELEGISWPSEIKVEFGTASEEEGFYRSVPDSHINDDDWEEWADKGSESLPMSVMDDASALTQTTSFSYCWYLPFKVLDFTAYRSMGTENYYTRYIPVIGKSEWWIEDYEYRQMMAKDGRSLKQRFWFRSLAGTTLPLPSNGYAKAGGGDNLVIDLVYFCTPTGSQTINGKKYYLNYNYSDDSLLNRYFNVELDSRCDQITIETYISPQEYKEIRMGRTIKVNDDIYVPMKITSYNPSSGKIKIEALST